MVTSIAIMGLGKLGSPLAACFAASGFCVRAVDVDEQKVDALNRGVPPVHEPGLAELILESGVRLRTSQDVEGAVRDSEATLHCGWHPERTRWRVLSSVCPPCLSIDRACPSDQAGNGPVGILGLTYKPDNRVASVNTKFRFLNSARQCIQLSDVVVVATPWVQFQQIPAEQWARRSSPRTVVDCWQALPQLNGVEGVHYVRLGFGEEVARAAETGFGTD
jgi:UDP-glucose 6-dehydrogenase